MKQAILIQCHNNPELIEELIDFFPKDCFDFYIHIDKKSNMTIHARQNVHLVENRVDVRWGRFSQVEATYALIDSISKPSQYSYCHLISGADFPVKDVNGFMNYFSNNTAEYIESNYLDGTSTWSWGGKDRFQVYYPQWMIQRPQSNKWKRIIRVLYREFVMRTKIFKRRDQPVERFYGGSSWWSLTGDCVEWIKYNTKPDYYNFFRHGVCVDEIYFSTLVRYSPFSENIVGKHKRYMIWDDPNNASGGPAVITDARIEGAISSEDFFARKVVDLKVARQIEMLLMHGSK